MVINIHPFIVHFPIALLIIYSLMEFLRFKFLTKQNSWFYIKFSFLFLGVLSTFPALSSGELVEDLYEGTSQGALVELHSSWAVFPTVIFSVLAVSYLILLLEQKIKTIFKENKSIVKIWSLLNIISSNIINTPLIFVFIVLGLFSIIATGALGGAIVYGPDVDPFVKFIYNLFF